MDNKEMLYELALKYNTLKMYDNTIGQMKKSNYSQKTLDRVISERDSVEKEFNELLNPELEVDENRYDTYKFPKMDKEEVKSNKFINEMNKKSEIKNLYNIKKDFFDSIKNKDTVKSMLNKIAEEQRQNKSISYATTAEDEYERVQNELKEKKPTYADIQEKISSSQWISCSNFIVNLPKDKIDIEPWRISGFYYDSSINECSINQRNCNKRGVIYLTVNDFAEVKDDGKYVILSEIINSLSKYKVNILGDFKVDVINNDGVVLYTLCFTNCLYESYEADSFSYEVTCLRKFRIKFTYDELKIIAPVKKDETTN